MPERAQVEARRTGAARAARKPRVETVPSPPVERLARWVERMKGLPALVWGDFVLDEYWRCLSSRVSREAPVLVLDYQSRATYGGGAANAALNLAALGARVAVAGWVGADPAGVELRAALDRAGIDTRGLLELRGSGTVVKTRIVAGSVHTAQQQVVRVDRGAAFRAGAGSLKRLRDSVAAAAAGARAVVLSDYGYDSVTAALANPMVARWRAQGIAVGLDARYRLTEYRGVSIATPNEGEAASASGIAIRGDADLVRAAARLGARLKARHLVITRGRDGLTLWDEGRLESLEAWGGDEAVDVTGAGDAVVTTATLALAAGAPGLEAAALANVAGSVAVSRRGAVAVGHADLKRALRRGGAGR